MSFSCAYVFVCCWQGLTLLQGAREVGAHIPSGNWITSPKKHTTMEQQTPVGFSLGSKPRRVPRQLSGFEDSDDEMDAAPSQPSTSSQAGEDLKVRAHWRATSD